MCVCVTVHVAAVRLPVPVCWCVCLFVSFVLFAYSMYAMCHIRVVFTFVCFHLGRKYISTAFGGSGSRIALLLLLFTHFKHFHNLLEIDEDRMWYARDERQWRMGGRGERILSMSSIVKSMAMEMLRVCVYVYKYMCRIIQSININIFAIISFCWSVSWHSRAHQFNFHTRKHSYTHIHTEALRTRKTATVYQQRKTINAH